MGPREMKKVSDRVHNLRARLSGTTSLLETLSRNVRFKDRNASEDMCLAMLAIQTVIDDLASVCRDHLNDAADPSQQSAVSRTDMEGVLSQHTEC